MLGQQTIRRKLFQGTSPPSDSGSRRSDQISLGKRRSEQSVLSRRSGGIGSVRSGTRKSIASDYEIRHDSKWLKGREYLLIMIEAFLSLAVYVVSERNTSKDELERVKLTLSAVNIRSMYAEGYSTILSLIIGCLADSYFRLYNMALITVILHFFAVCVVFMEDTVKLSQKGNPYAEIVWNVCAVTLVFIKSSDFIRLVYGLEGMTNRRKSTIYIFIFTQFVVSNYATYGGVYVNLFAPLFTYTNTRLTIVAFVGTGISLFVFVYVLTPESTEDRKGLGCRIVGCLLLASYYKLFGIKIRGKKGFFGNAEAKYDKATVTRTKEILTLYALFLPTTSMAFFTVFRFDIYFDVMFRNIKEDSFTEAVGLVQLVRSVSFSSMLFAFFVVWPLLTLIGVRKRETFKFLLGHLLVMVGFFYAGNLMKDLEAPRYSSSSGFVRVFNTRKEPVYFETRDPGFTTRDFVVGSRMGYMAAYPVYGDRSLFLKTDRLFAMNVLFNRNTTNFTMFLSVARNIATGYMIVDPPEVIRIRGPYLPLREGPPGTNRGSWPRIFIYNTAETLRGARIQIRANTSGNTLETVNQVTIKPGVMENLALKPNKYEFSIPQAEIKKTFNLEQGAVYGIMFFATSSSREIEIDTIIEPNSTSWLILIGMFIVFGMAYGVGTPALRAMVFIMAPRGLPAMSFSFIASLEGLSMWLMFLGFSTWHKFVTSFVIFAYGFGMTLFFTLNMFVLLKFRDLYS